MRLHGLTRGFLNGAVVLVAMACILLALAATAGAVPADNVGAPSASRAAPAPTVVTETVVRPGDGTGAIVLVLIGIGAGAALLGTGYLGGSLVTRTSGVPLTTDVSAKSSTPTHRGRAWRSGICETPPRVSPAARQPAGSPARRAPFAERWR